MSVEGLAMGNASSRMAASEPSPMKFEETDAQKQQQATSTTLLDPSIDPSLDFAMPAPASATSLSSTAGNAFLAAINRFTVAIAPKPTNAGHHDLFNDPIDIPVPHQRLGAAHLAPNTPASHHVLERANATDPRFADATPQDPHRAQLASLLAHTNSTHEHSNSSMGEVHMAAAAHQLHTPSQARSNSPGTLAQSAGRRKRGSSENPTPRSSVVRVKPPEQLAAEALIEQQNPNATRNQLRSLKLRALHAGRIAERELGMSEEEKARRLRLREYVRQKRADEREEKLRAKKELVESGGLAPSLANANGNAGDEQSLNLAAKIDTSFVHDPKLFGLSTASASNGTSQFQHAPKMIPEWHDPALHTPQRPITTNTSASAPTTAAPGKRKRASADTPGGSEPRRKSSSRVKTAEQTSLEAQIERENPHASKTQLKSLKLRALHAGRIAERERDMSEKEKARRLKLREYMRRRREEERGDVIVKPEVKPEMGVEGRLGLMAGTSTSTELNADDRSAAFSIMGLNQSFLHGPSAPVPALPSVPQTQTDHNLHLHPLFQMPVPLGPLPSTHFDPAINNTTTSATTTSNFADVWSSLPSDSNERANGDPTAEELAERALHAALEEAIELQEQEARLQEQADHQHQQQSNSEALEQERIRIAEEEILGVERERIADAELAIIAHHHQQTSSEALEQERIRIAEEEILGVERARVAAAVANVGNGGD